MGKPFPSSVQRKVRATNGDDLRHKLERGPERGVAMVPPNGSKTKPFPESPRKGLCEMISLF